MTRKTGKISFGLIMVVALAGCEELGIELPAPQKDASATASAPRVAGGEAERPDLFSETGNAVWDGRPTLGGIWVASTKTKDLERVRITRSDNGQSVEGALFRIEPGTPGPGLVLSSDAAKELGVAPGAVTGIAVVALRRTQQPAPAPAAEAAPAAAQTEIAQSELAPAGVETAAAQSGSKNAPMKTSIPSVFKKGSAPAAIPAAAPSSAPARSNNGPSDPEVSATQSAGPANAPFLEIGTYKTQLEADTVLAKLASQGLSGQKREKRVLFAKQWVVFAGPFSSAPELVDARKKAQAAGFDGVVVTAR